MVGACLVVLSMCIVPSCNVLRLYLLFAHSAKLAKPLTFFRVSKISQSFLLHNIFDCLIFSPSCEKVNVDQK